jgi:hypothetical protein
MAGQATPSYDKRLSSCSFKHKFCMYTIQNFWYTVAVTSTVVLKNKMRAICCFSFGDNFANANMSACPPPLHHRRSGRSPPAHTHTSTHTPPPATTRKRAGKEKVVAVCDWWRVACRLLWAGRRILLQSNQASLLLFIVLVHYRYCMDSTASTVVIR